MVVIDIVAVPTQRYYYLYVLSLVPLFSRLIQISVATIDYFKLIFKQLIVTKEY